MTYNKSELQTVKILGESMGYGRIMQIASALWAISLEDNHGLGHNNGGAFLYTIPEFMVKKEAARSLDERATVIKMIRSSLK